MAGPVLRYKAGDVEFEAGPGEIVGITGRSGAGKTTVLRLVAGVVEADGVTVDVDGDVAWMVAAVPVPDPGAYLVPPVEVSLRPTTDPPAVVICDEAFDSLANPGFLDLSWGTLADMAEAGAVVVVASHCADTVHDGFCDVIRSVDGSRPQDRVALHSVNKKRTGPTQLLPDAAAELREVVDVHRFGLPVVDPDRGAFVLLPQIPWECRSVSSWVEWVLVDPIVIRTMMAPPTEAFEADRDDDEPGPEDIDQADEADDGPWYGLAATPEFLAARLSYDPADPATVIRPLALNAGKQVEPTDAPQPRSALFDCFEAGSPVVPTAEQCADLIARYGGRAGRLTNDTGNRWTTDVPTREPVAAMAIELARAANRRWWRIGVDVWIATIVRYATGCDLRRHNDCYVGREINKLSVSVQLSPPDDYEGGAVVVDHHNRYPELDGERWFEDGFVVPQEPGTVVTWPAYLAHTVEPVTAGERWALLIFGYGPPFR